MNAESNVSFSNSSLDLSVKKSSSSMFPIFPAIIFAFNRFTVCFLSGFWSVLSIASFLSSSQKKTRPTRSSVRYHKWFKMALTADSAILLSMSWYLCSFLINCKSLWGAEAADGRSPKPVFHVGPISKQQTERIVVAPSPHASLTWNVTGTSKLSNSKESTVRNL